MGKRAVGEGVQVGHLHVQIAWSAILLGLLAGAVTGLFFARDDWLGGYGSWRRRMLRLGHVAFVGTGLLNLAFAVSVDRMGIGAPVRIASILLVVGTVTMPPVCLLSARWKPVRHLFFIPVTCLVAATAICLVRGFSL
jgi:hypothetical protein